MGLTNYKLINESFRGRIYIISFDFCIEKGLDPLNLNFIVPKVKQVA